MTSSFRYSTFALALLSIAAVAQQDENSTTEQSNSWRENVIAECQRQFTSEQCQDPAFLEENFHLQSLETAHRAAIRRTDLERRALNELTLQRICAVSPSSACATTNDPRCAAQVEQTCANLKNEAAACVQNAKNYCASASDANCFAQQTLHCPSAKKQPVEKVLAKYPKLSLEQKLRLTRIAQELDAKQGNWFSRLLDRVGL